VAPLLAAGPASLLIANRTVARAADLAREFATRGDVDSCSFDAVPASLTFDLVINATSAGVRGETPPYPQSALSKDTICYDLSYGLSPTPFSRWAADQGAVRSIMGWGMLVEQAAESFHIWRGVRPDTSAVLKQMAVNAS
jgi:shikimate dehydrogenase